MVPERGVDHRLQTPRRPRPCRQVLVGGGRGPLRPRNEARPVLGEEAVPQLKAGCVGTVLAALRRAGGGECGKAARCIAELRDRMRYDDE